MREVAGRLRGELEAERPIVGLEGPAGGARYLQTVTEGHEGPLPARRPQEAIQRLSRW